MPRSKAARAAAKALKALYASLPTINCQGLCHASCGRIEECLTPLELETILSRLKVDQPANAGCKTCPLLDKNNRCSVYDVRPLICRLYGLVDDDLMRCRWGCEPSRYLSNREAQRLWAKLEAISMRWQHETQSENHGVASDELATTRLDDSGHVQE